MTKVFDPKITPGPWEKFLMHQISTQNGAIIATIHKQDPMMDKETIGPIAYEENKKAILAVPEMLEVVKAVRDYIFECENCRNGTPTHDDFIALEDAYTSVTESIKKLDEMHGMEVSE